jgi:hypothetical protein
LPWIQEIGFDAWLNALEGKIKQPIHFLLSFVTSKDVLEPKKSKLSLLSLLLLVLS